MQLFAVITAALALLTTPVFGAPTEQLKTVRKYAGPTKPDSYIVKLKDDVSKDVHLAWLASNHNASSNIVYSNWDSEILHGYAGTLGTEALDALLAHPDVDYIEEDGVVDGSATVTQTNAPWGLGRISQNPRLSNQNPNALNFTYRFDSSAGNGVDIFIIDTGIFVGHNEFQGRAVWGATFGPYPSVDDNGHGTHVAGIAGGATYGVAKRARLIAVKVLNFNNTGFISDIIAGADFVAQVVPTTGRPSIASMSLGAPASPSIDNAVAGLVARGIHVVVAAGNSNIDASAISPARSPAVVTVGATTIADMRWPLSNWGSVLDVFAPGANIISAGISGPNSLAVMSGTSMACPHVSGMFAVWISLFGNLAPGLMVARLDSFALKNILNGIPIGTVNLLARNEQ